MSGIQKGKFKPALTGNGTEFSDQKTIEFSPTTGRKLCSVFYCDPHASYQKGMLKKNHAYIRYILPKDMSFAGLTQEDASRIADSINSVPQGFPKREDPLPDGGDPDVPRMPKRFDETAKTGNLVLKMHIRPEKGSYFCI